MNEKRRLKFSQLRKGYTKYKNRQEGSLTVNTTISVAKVVHHFGVNPFHRLNVTHLVLIYTLSKL